MDSIAESYEKERNSNNKAWISELKKIIMSSVKATHWDMTYVVNFNIQDNTWYIFGKTFKVACYIGSNEYFFETDSNLYDWFKELASQAKYKIIRGP